MGDDLDDTGPVVVGPWRRRSRRVAYENPWIDVWQDEVDRPDVDLVLLPDEPYVFTAEDGPEAFTQAPTALVSGRLLTWYGPSLLEARSFAPSSP